MRSQEPAIDPADEDHRRLEPGAPRREGGAQYRERVVEDPSGAPKASSAPVGIAAGWVAATSNVSYSRYRSRFHSTERCTRPGE
jgi:hypothetical protein